MRAAHVRAAHGTCEAVLRLIQESICAPWLTQSLYDHAGWAPARGSSLAWRGCFCTSVHAWHALPALSPGDREDCERALPADTWPRSEVSSLLPPGTVRRMTQMRSCPCTSLGASGVRLPRGAHALTILHCGGGRVLETRAPERLGSQGHSPADVTTSACASLVRVRERLQPDTVRTGTRTAHSTAVSSFPNDTVDPPTQGAISARLQSPVWHLHGTCAWCKSEFAASHQCWPGGRMKHRNGGSLACWSRQLRCVHTPERQTAEASWRSCT